MKIFLVTASDDICRDGQYLNFKELEELDKTGIDKSSSDGEWYDFEGEFVLDTCVAADSKKEALQEISEAFDIDIEYLKAYELA